MDGPLRPLTSHGWDALAILKGGDRPSQEFNAGVGDRLLRERLVEHYTAPSPYPSRKGKACGFYRITYAGRAKLLEAPRYEG